MMQRLRLRLTAALTCSGLAAVSGQTLPGGTTHHVMIDGVRIHYESYGQGRPVVLLHGGLFGSIAEFSGLIPVLARDHRVIAIALRGHGVSQLGAEPLTTRRFAEDAAAIIRQETRDSTIIIGFSTGAIASYLLAIEAPELVRAVVAIGGPIAMAGWTAAGLEEAAHYAFPERLDSLYPALVARQKRLYANAEEWHTVVRAFAAMTSGSDIPESSVRAVAQPVLILAGDRDHYARTDHFVRIAELFPHGSLAVLPGCGHVVLACAPRLVEALILDFLRRGS
jgi:pimeloyl-ACP methyl ester carboxylesterase